MATISRDRDGRPLVQLDAEEWEECERGIKLRMNTRADGTNPQARGISNRRAHTVGVLAEKIVGVYYGGEPRFSTVADDGVDFMLRGKRVQVKGSTDLPYPDLKIVADREEYLEDDRFDVAILVAVDVDKRRGWISGAATNKLLMNQPVVVRRKGWKKEKFLPDRVLKRPEYPPPMSDEDREAMRIENERITAELLAEHPEPPPPPSLSEIWARSGSRSARVNEWVVKYTNKSKKGPHGHGPFFASREHAADVANLLQRTNPHLTARLFFRHHEIRPDSEPYDGSTHRFEPKERVALDDWDFWRELPREEWVSDKPFSSTLPADPAPIGAQLGAKM